MIPPAISTPTDAPPAYTFPTTFRIGEHLPGIAPLIDIARVRTHLALLRAFAALRSEVEHAELPLPCDAARRWSCFVHLAVERFERWCCAIRDAEGSGAEVGMEDMPPLDVLMVWHTYMLNPSWYMEDTMRIPALSALPRYSAYFMTLLTDHIFNDANMSANPTSKRAEAWTSKTSTPFDPLEAAATLKHKKLTCPKCGTVIPQAPFVNDHGTGYVQLNFSMRCPTSCGYTITKEKLALGKFAKDAVRDDQTNYAFFAGTLFTPTDSQDKRRAKIIKDAIMTSRLTTNNSVKLHGASLEQHILDVGSFVKLRQLAATGLRANGGRIIGRIMTAYTDERMFSVDLVGAVLRQGSFIAKMCEMRWTELTFFNDPQNELVLQHAIARYHGFLDLMSSSPASFFVPTLDIDLAWHTHQLMPQTYASDCTKYIGRYIDHNDKVDEDELSNAFDLTCRAWETRFGIPYTHCGCPLPGTTLAQKLQRLAHDVRPRPHLVPPAAARAGTHPSDHSAVFATRLRELSEIHRERRAAKRAKRVARDEALARKGKLVPGEREAGRGHDVNPFMAPVPFYYYTAAPVAACAAESAGVVDFNAGDGCVAGDIGCVTGGTAACGGSAGCGGGCSGGGGGCSGGGCSGGGGGCGGS